MGSLKSFYRRRKVELSRTRNRTPPSRRSKKKRAACLDYESSNDRLDLGANPGLHLLGERWGGELTK